MHKTPETPRTPAATPTPMPTAAPVDSLPLSSLSGGGIDVADGLGWLVVMVALFFPGGGVGAVVAEPVGVADIEAVSLPSVMLKYADALWSNFMSP